MRILFLAATAALLSVPSAFAGGYVSPSVNIEPNAAPAGEWQGAYAGLTLGYAFDGDDRIGPYDGWGNAQVSGVNAGVRLGYRWQRDRWVFGPEIAYVAGSIDDSFPLDEGEFTSEVNHMLGLRLKAGRLVGTDTLIYGILGWQQGDFTYNEAGTDIDYDADGHVIGLGIEKRLTDRLSITGEYEFSQFGRTTVTHVNEAISAATPEHSNVKLGVNYRF